MKINYKTICKALNDFAASDDYDKPAMLRVELTSFQDLHKAHRGRNGVGELVELVTRVIEADAVHVAPSDRSTLVSVYIKARTRGGHGFGSDGGIFLRVRDAKGKYHSMELYSAWERKETKVDNLLRAFGEDTPARFDAEGFARFAEEEAETVVKLVKAQDSEEETERRTARLQRDFAVKFYQDLVNYDLDREHGGKLQEFAAFAGGSVVTHFNFTDRVHWISPDYVDVTKNAVEIGWMQRNTYNSLPATLRIVKTREIKAVRLMDIGVEEAGYYDHTDKLRVLPEQVAKVRKFAARFKSKQAKVTKRALESVRKAG